jgi:hypothetical protein
MRENRTSGLKRAEAALAPPLLDRPSAVIADPIALDRVIAQSSEPKFVTFINPQPDKGVTVFARIALELGATRPDIPILVVEGRATSDTLAALPVATERPTGCGCAVAAGRRWLLGTALDIMRPGASAGDPAMASPSAYSDSTGGSMDALVCV